MESADAASSGAADSTSVALTGERNVKLHTQRRERALTRTLLLTCLAYFVWDGIPLREWRQYSRYSIGLAVGQNIGVRVGRCIVVGENVDLLGPG